MDRLKFDQMVELLKEGKGSQAISKAIGQSHGIVDWNLLFIKVHGEETARLYNDGIGRPSYTKEQILGIYNFALASDCGFERAEIYFKIKRNKLLEKVKKYIGKENIGKEAENAVPMYPDVKRNCDEFIAVIPDELFLNFSKFRTKTSKILPKIFFRARRDSFDSTSKTDRHLSIATLQLMMPCASAITPVTG